MCQCFYFFPSFPPRLFVILLFRVFLYRFDMYMIALCTVLWAVHFSEVHGLTKGMLPEGAGNTSGALCTVWPVGRLRHTGLWSELQWPLSDHSARTVTRHRINPLDVHSNVTVGRVRINPFECRQQKKRLLPEIELTPWVSTANGTVTELELTLYLKNGMCEWERETFFFAISIYLRVIFISFNQHWTSPNTPFLNVRVCSWLYFCVCASFFLFYSPADEIDLRNDL